MNQILDDYRTHAAREGGGGNAGCGPPVRVFKAHAVLTTMYRLTGEVVAGLKLYFTKCVGNNLLYRFERGRYQDYVDKNDPKDGSELDLAAVYGAEHLLRLFGASCSRTAATLATDQALSQSTCLSSSHTQQWTPRRSLSCASSLPPSSSAFAPRPCLSCSDPTCRWFANNKNKYFGAEYETMPLSYSNMNRT